MKAIAIALSAALALSMAGTAMAQRAASTKMLGTAYDMWSSGAYFDNAYNHAVVMQNYASAGQRVPQQIVQQHTEAIRSSLAAAKKSYDNLAKTHKDDATAAKHLDKIDEHHAAALGHVDKLAAAAKEGDAEAGAVHASSAAAAKSIQAAQAEHEKLMKHLKVAKPDPAAKPAPIE